MASRCRLKLKGKLADFPSDVGRLKNNTCLTLLNPTSCQKFTPKPRKSKEPIVFSLELFK